MVAVRATSDEWINGLSVHAQVLRMVKRRDVTVDEAVSAARPRVAALRALSEEHEGNAIIPGEYVDAIWKNAFVVSGNVRFVDLEWEVLHQLETGTLMVRALYWCLHEAKGIRDAREEFCRGPRLPRIQNLGTVLGIDLPRSAFRAFVDLDSRLTETMHGRPRRRTRLVLLLTLWSLRLLRALRWVRSGGARMKRLLGAVQARLTIMRQRGAREAEQP